MPLSGVPLYPEGIIDRLQAPLDAGDREAMMTTFYREVVGILPDELEQMRSSSAWTTRVARGHNVPRESQAEERYAFDAQLLKDMHTPTLLLLGGDSPHFLKAATEAVDAALPNRRIVVMPGQQHIAMVTAPDLFAHEALAFLTG